MSSRPDIKFEDLREVAVIGSGTFGVVRMVKFRETGEVFALKAMWRDQIKHMKAGEYVLSVSVCQNVKILV